MIDVVLLGVFAVLLANYVLALSVFARRGLAGNWLLVVLLTGTTGAALAAVLAALSEDGSRYLDVALVLTGTAAVAAAVRAGLPRRIPPPGAEAAA
ncbi:hypothetical protein BG28_03455 [Nesterenkonia sp. AN1]|uniref:Uncharacterized protein n=1 Tax=Nesterenkonia aurantiaca TaxID=1436010 RepID=A0A4R7G8I0_9MICC|nr:MULTISPECIES: hypothetical protein [Nesterenkonia]EXF24782.1 hypothetical protein BG28_03455 [Nesterenkonia sp. AN1]TDS87796.1 hypothetical protein EV640_101592 [Nesterenkonia aurantiaca]